MRWYTYDVEVYPYDFFVGFKDKATGERYRFHNDNIGVRDFIDENCICCGFNNKNYDQYIIKAICAGFSPEEVKALNDWCISGNQGWQYPLLRGVWYKFNDVDITMDMQRDNNGRLAQSLKVIQGHLFLPIVECDVDFETNRPLTQEEILSVFKYNDSDIDSTEKITEIRSDYLRTKLNLGRRANINEIKALAATNAKLTAMMLGAVKREWNDGREYVYPPNLDTSIIPKEILDFFDTIHDTSIPDDVLFKTSLKINLGGMPCKFAWGGVHGSLTRHYEESTEDRVIQNRDVSSLYPSLIEGYNYLSRNVPDPQLFYDIRKDRIRAKHEGDKQTATDLKLPLNTVSGAQENQYNDLYDPLPTRSMRISGQLFLTMLTMRLLNECKTIKLLNLNTDGLMYSVDKSELPIVDKIASDWEKTTGFELETDSISKVWLKDVNNLLFIDTNGKVKTVGSYLNYGISVKGAWSINNNMIIVKKALIEHFVNGTPPEETINACDDIFQFQIIAKAGNTYREAYHLVDGKQEPVQKVNRVYATTDSRYGKIYKVKAENDSTAKIESLPEHCIIDNANELTIESIDKSWYIELAKKRINDFLGIQKIKNKKEKNKMATTKTTETMNVYQKLLKARTMFLGSNTQKSGKNMHLAFKYFELDDIVPIATKIFEEVGLISIVSFAENSATMNILNTDNPDESISFTAPLIQLGENKGTNAVQAFGSTVTYYRRYLYMIALDICEPDEIDGGLKGNIPSTPTAPTPAPVVTPEVKSATPAPINLAPAEKPLTNADGNASEIQIKQLKEVLKKLKDSDPSKEDLIHDLAVKTKGFTVISKADCEALTVKIGELLKETK